MVEFKDGNGQRVQEGDTVVVARKWKTYVVELVVPGDPRIAQVSLYNQGAVLVRYEGGDLVMHENGDPDIELTVS